MGPPDDLEEPWAPFTTPLRSTLLPQAELRIFRGDLVYFPCPPLPRRALQTMLPAQSSFPRPFVQVGSSPAGQMFWRAFLLGPAGPRLPDVQLRSRFMGAGGAGRGWAGARGSCVGPDVLESLRGGPAQLELTEQEGSRNGLGERPGGIEPPGSLLGWPQSSSSSPPPPHLKPQESRTSPAVSCGRCSRALPLHFRKISGPTRAAGWQGQRPSQRGR